MARISFNRKGTKYTGEISPEKNPIYNQAYVGNAFKVLFQKNLALPSDVDAKNVIARGQNYNYQENYQLLPVMEWDVYFIQELLLGMQEMGSFDCSAMFTLRLNDSLPTVRTLAWEPDMTVIQSIGQDHPLYGLVTNAWYGARFSGRGSTMSPNGVIMENIRGMYRYRLAGKDWALMNPSTTPGVYSGKVSEVDMGTIIPNITP